MIPHGHFEILLLKLFAGLLPLRCQLRQIGCLVDAICEVSEATRLGNEVDIMSALCAIDLNRLDHAFHGFSYGERRRLGMVGDEISNRLWLSFPGRVTGTLQAIANRSLKARKNAEVFRDSLAG